MQYGKVKGLFLLRKIKSVRAAEGGVKKCLTSIFLYYKK
jgi:hypothetical protein